MTTLSIMLYLAGVFSTLKIIGMFVIAAGIVAGCALPANKNIEIFSYDHEYPFMGFGRYPTIILFCLGFFLIAFFPSKETTYMIIATEMTNRAIQTEEARIIFDKVHQFIDLKLEGMKK
jgi:hypothetical protein